MDAMDDAKEVLGALAWQCKNYPTVYLCTSHLKRDCGMEANIGVRMRSYYGYCPCDCHADRNTRSSSDDWALETFVRENWE